MQPIQRAPQRATTELAQAGWISFDCVNIDPEGRRLRVDGHAIPLEPKAFDVLALLATHPGHAFTREEILDAVWGHRHVTPGVLNRIVTLLRQALGESANAPHYIHTLHGVGYRFDAPLGTLTNGHPVVPAVADPPPPPMQLDLQQTFGAASPADDAAPNATRFADHAAGIERASAPARAQWHRLIALLLALAAACGLWLAWFRESPRTPSHDPPTLIVLPLQAVGSDRGEAVLADGLSEELITRLARADGLRLISSTSAQRAREQHLDPAQLAQRTGATHALEGSLRESSGTLRIALRLIETPSGRTLWAQDYDRKLDDVLALQSDIAQAVTRALTLRFGLVGKRDAPVDAEHYREYLALRTRMFSLQMLTPAASEDLVTRMRALAQRAPEYARAHGLLARYLAKPHDYSPSPAQIEESAREARRTLALDPDSVDAHVALGLLAYRSAQWETAFSELRRALELDPTDNATRACYGYMLAGLGYLEQGLQQSQIAWRSDPLSYPASFMRARLLDTLGRHDEARRAFDRTALLDPLTPRFLVYARWYNAVWSGDLTAAAAFAAQMSAEDGFRDAYLAVTAALRDPANWPAAESLIAASERKTGHYNFTRMQLPDFDKRAAFARMEAMLYNGFPSYFVMIWQGEYVAMRRGPEFQDYLRRTHTLDYWRAHGFPPQCTPDGDGAKCD